MANKNTSQWFHLRQNQQRTLDERRNLHFPSNVLVPRRSEYILALSERTENWSWKIHIGKRALQYTRMIGLVLGRTSWRLFESNTFRFLSNALRLLILCKKMSNGSSTFRGVGLVRTGAARLRPSESMSHDNLNEIHNRGQRHASPKPVHCNHGEELTTWAIR